MKKKDKKNDNRKELASRLKKIRLALNLKQKEIAKALNISSATYSEVEVGNYNPNFYLIENIVLKYKVNLYYLLFGKGEMFIGIEEGLKRGATDFAAKDAEVEKFLWYFERSPIVQYHILGKFRRFIQKEKEDVERDISIHKKE